MICRDRTKLTAMRPQNRLVPLNLRWSKRKQNKNHFYWNTSDVLFCIVSRRHCHIPSFLLDIIRTLVKRSTIDNSENVTKHRNIILFYPFLIRHIRQKIRFNEPWQPEAQQYVKCIRTDWIAYSHRTVTLICHDDTRHRLWYRCSCCQKGQAHNRVWNINGVT